MEAMIIIKEFEQNANRQLE